jgi:hypothetical protein
MLEPICPTLLNKTRKLNEDVIGLKNLCHVQYTRGRLFKVRLALVNPGLKFNPLPQFLYFYTFVYFTNQNYYIDPDEICEETFPS